MTKMGEKALTDAGNLAYTVHANGLRKKEWYLRKGRSNYESNHQ